MLLKLVELGWGRDNPAFRQFYMTIFIPDSKPEQFHWFTELQRMSYPDLQTALRGLLSAGPAERAIQASSFERRATLSRRRSRLIERRRGAPPGRYFSLSHFTGMT